MRLRTNSRHAECPYQMDVQYMINLISYFSQRIDLIFAFSGSSSEEIMSQSECDTRANPGSNGGFERAPVLELLNECFWQFINWLLDGSLNLVSSRSKCRTLNATHG